MDATRALAVAGLIILVCIAFMPLQNTGNENIEQLRFGENTIILNFRDNVFNITDASGDYTRLSVGNHTITSYNSSYDVKMYWRCNNSNWTLVTE